MLLLRASTVVLVILVVGLDIDRIALSSDMLSHLSSILPNRYPLQVKRQSPDNTVLAQLIRRQASTTRGGHREASAHHAGSDLGCALRFTGVDRSKVYMVSFLVRSVIPLLV